MTTFRCKTCGSTWSEGPTRDCVLDQDCRYCAGGNQDNLVLQIADLQGQMAKMKSTISFLRTTLTACAAHAGLPDPATGCRAVIATVKDALAIP